MHNSRKDISQQDIDKAYEKASDFLYPKPYYTRITPKIGRNEPCLCGSGKKYKKCCLQEKV